MKKLRELAVKLSTLGPPKQNFIDSASLGVSSFLLGEGGSG